MVRCAALCGLVAASLCFAARARAELTHRVVLLNPLAPDETTFEAITRVRGELNAAGFDVVPVPHRGGAEPRDELESASRDVGALAGFAIVRSDTGDTAEILVLDRLRGKVFDQRMAFDRRTPRRAAAVLAVGAVELLKASLAEFWLSPSSQPPAPRVDKPPPTVVVREPPPPPPAPPRVGIEAGAAVLTHLGSMGTVASPLLKVSYRATHLFSVRAAISSVGIQSSIEGSAGSALLGQELATLDAVFMWPEESSVHAVASAGVGAYHLRVQGVGNGSTHGLTNGSWSAALVPGLGGQADLTSHIALSGEAQILFALPPPIVRIGVDEFGPAGRPSLVISAGVTGNF